MLNFFKILFSPIIAILDFITKYFKTIVFLTIIYFVVYGGNNTNDVNIDGQSANLQKINLYGQISDVSKVLEQINMAKEDDNIKGVLIDVNSPGGSVAPSIELAYAIKELKQIKPVVVYASGVMASGGYYASIWADEIIANPGSMIGSIGVIMQGVNAKELMDKIGISSQVVKAGKYKQMGTYDRKWEDFEREQLQSVVSNTYEMFISDVSKARKLDVKDHTKYADAKIFTAIQAKEVGLVDTIGTISFAQDSLVKHAKVEKAVWKKQDKFEKFMDKLLQETINKISIIFMTQLKAI